MSRENRHPRRVDSATIQAMSREKPAPPVVSTSCSGLMSCSCLSRHRRGPPQPVMAAPRRRRSEAAGDAAFEIAERVQLLEEEEEVRRLSVQEVVRPPAPGAAAATESVVVVRGRASGGGGGEATRRVGNGGSRATADGCTASTGTTTTTTAAATRCAGVCCRVHEVVRLEDGSYMREVRRPVGRRPWWPWERLAVQVSRPAVPVDVPSASEVLGKMAAIRAEDLCKFLVQLMPLKDITGQRNPGEPVRRRTARPISGDGLVEALILDAMGKLEYLALEGLKIQMQATELAMATAAAAVGDGRRDKAVIKDCMVHVVLMQARDPKERYGAIGEPMIGLIETSLEKKKDGTARLRMLGLHVAGISVVVIRRPISDGRYVLWSAYLRRCKESHDGDDGGDGCRRCICVRNPNRVLPSK